MLFRSCDNIKNKFCKFIKENKEKGYRFLFNKDFKNYSELYNYLTSIRIYNACNALLDIFKNKNTENLCSQIKIYEDRFNIKKYKFNHICEIFFEFYTGIEMSEEQYNRYVDIINKHEKFLNSNKSFCIYPWINIVMENDKSLQVCARTTNVVTFYDKLTDWKNDPNFGIIRKKMLAGEPLPSSCKVCYSYEKTGAESYRQYETREWLNLLEIKNLEDLNKIDRPYYYEIRLSNKCNAMCRGCRPAFSHLVAKESKEFNIAPLSIVKPSKYGNVNIIDIDLLTNKHRVYLTGGEPTIMTEVLQFMQNCIDKNKTDFEFTISTNGEKFSNKFLKLSEIGRAHV